MLICTRYAKYTNSISNEERYVKKMTLKDKGGIYERIEFRIGYRD